MSWRGSSRRGTTLRARPQPPLVQTGKFMGLPRSWSEPVLTVPALTVCPRRGLLSGGTGPASRRPRLAPRSGILVPDPPTWGAGQRRLACPQDLAAWPGGARTQDDPAASARGGARTCFEAAGARRPARPRTPGWATEPRLGAGRAHPGTMAWAAGHLPTSASSPRRAGEPTRQQGVLGGRPAPRCSRPREGLRGGRGAALSREKATLRAAGTTALSLAPWQAGQCPVGRVSPGPPHLSALREMSCIFPRAQAL